jgi:hypothetical protein
MYSGSRKPDYKNLIIIMEIKVKIPKPHNFEMFIIPVGNIPSEWKLGKLDDKGKLIQNEVELTVDEKKCTVKMHDYLYFEFNQFTLLNFWLKAYFGVDSDRMKEILKQKFKNFDSKTQFAIVLYEIKEIG